MATKRLSMIDGLSPKEAAFLKRGAQPAEEETNKQTNKFTEMVTFTVRLPRATASTLRKASVERKIAGLVPATQQEIVQDAIERWLKEHQRA